LGDLRGRDVLEVAAGTGLWTRFLGELGANVTAVEPDDAMRAVLERRSPHVTTLRATAESIPVLGASFDAVLVSSAWHWFDQARAGAEMARVLRDDGSIFILWNGLSRTVDWVKELTALRARSADPPPSALVRTVQLPDEFVDLRDVAIDWTRDTTIDQVVALFSTYSDSIVSSESEMVDVRREVRRLLEGHEGDGVISLPMTLRGYVARRAPRRSP
jgi:SAM-dependent methyltransferase